MNLSKMGILFIVSLIVMITPAIATELGDSENSIRNVNYNNKSISGNISTEKSDLDIVNNDMKSINSQVVDLKNIIFSLKESMEYIEYNFWKFWDWRLYSELVGITGKSYQLLDKSRKLNESADILVQHVNELKNNEDSLRADKYNKTTDQDVLIMSKRLHDYFGKNFTVSSPVGMKKGDLVAYKATDKQTVYLLFNKVDANGTVILMGDRSKIVNVPQSEISRIKAKLTQDPNSKVVKSSQIIKKAYTEEESNIDQKSSNAMEHKSMMETMQMVGGSITVFGIEYVFIMGGLALSLTVVAQLYDGSAIVLSIVCVILTILSVALGETGVLVQGLGIKYYNEDVNIIKEAFNEFMELQLYHELESPKAENMTLKTGINKELNSYFNATDASGDRCTPKIESQPEHGNVMVESDGNFTYISNKDYMGNDTFNYTVTDITGQISNTAQVKIIVENLSAPIADNMTISTMMDTELINNISAKGHLENCTYKIISQPEHGTLTLQDKGKFVYKPFKNYIGYDIFYYNVIDAKGQSSNIASVKIAVKNITKPTANNMSISTTINKVLISIFKATGDIFIPQLIIPPKHGKITMKSNGKFVYKPNSNYIGKDTFKFRVIDFTGQKSNTASVIITINKKSVINSTDDPDTPIPKTENIKSTYNSENSKTSINSRSDVLAKDDITILPVVNQIDTSNQNYQNNTNFNLNLVTEFRNELSTIMPTLRSIWSIILEKITMILIWFDTTVS
jgi:hypothetical protein